MRWPSSPQASPTTLLSTFYISVTAPVLVAPAMNTRMWFHPTTQHNLDVLRDRGVQVIDPESGWLAEREVGVGRLAEPARIIEATLAVLAQARSLEGKRVLISAGPTRERIDPVRFLTNRSSGKMGFALAAVAAQRGAVVQLVAGPVDLPTPYGVQRIDVESSAEMREAMLSREADADGIFMAAAVSDYLPRTAEQKIKKSGAALTLTFDEGPDILAELGRIRSRGRLVGFAAETQDLLDNARAKLARKGADFIVANDVSRSDIGFESDENAVTILDAAGGSHVVGKRSKQAIAAAILDHVFGHRPVTVG